MIDIGDIELEEKSEIASSHSELKSPLNIGFESDCGLEEKKSMTEKKPINQQFTLDLEKVMKSDEKAKF